MSKSKIPLILIAVVPFIIFLLHIKLFGNYLIDDIGILFAYARNIADGHGIVAQPGLKPVEGCSDFLWMMLFVPFFLLNIFDPVITTKIFCTSFILILYLFFAFGLKKELPDLLIFLFLSFLSITTPFAIWNCAGMENPLYILLIFLLFYYTYQILLQPKPGKNLFIKIGFITFLIALTRPDGMLYFFVPPILITVYYGLKIRLKSLPWKELIIYTLVAGGCFGLFLVFRYSYFGELVPNTFYFKGGPKKDDVLHILLLREDMVLKLQNLFSSVINIYAFLGIAILLILNCWIYFTKRFNEFHLSVTIFFIFAVINFLLLPNDWMAEFRFATPFIFFFYLILIYSLYILFTPLKYRLVFTSITLLLLSFPIAKDFVTRSTNFSNNPTVPFTAITARTALTFNEYSESLGLKNASLLTPDCGATLYYSKLRVFDMAGLIDKRYALTTKGKDTLGFNNIVFEIDKPTFIDIHSAWSYDIHLHNDPRFDRDYYPIWEYKTWISSIKYIRSGHYVRKNAINKDLVKKNSLFIQFIDSNVKVFNSYSLLSGIGKPSFDRNANFKYVLSNGNKKGCMLFGPYINLEAGKYKVIFHLKSNQVNPRKTPIGFVDVYCQPLQLLKKEIDTESIYSNSMFKKVEMDFYLNAPKENMEFRFFSEDNAEILFDYLELIKM